MQHWWFFGCPWHLVDPCPRSKLFAPCSVHQQLSFTHSLKIGGQSRSASSLLVSRDCRSVLHRKSEVGKPAAHCEPLVHWANFLVFIYHFTMGSTITRKPVVWCSGQMPLLSAFHRHSLPGTNELRVVMEFDSYRGPVCTRVKPLVPSLNKARPRVSSPKGSGC